MKKRQSIVLLLAVLLCCCRVVAQDAEKAEETPPTIEDQVKGEWVAYRDTPEGRFMTIKVHTGNRTVLTTYDPNRVPIYSHRSEYKIDESKNTYVFRYWNKTILSGPNAGANIKGESAYLFRIENDRFIEVHGMMKGDSGKPSLKIWERLKENPIAKPAA